MEYSEERTGLVVSASVDDWAGSESGLAGDAFVGTVLALERTAYKREKRSTAGAKGLAKSGEEKRWAQAVATNRGALCGPARRVDE